MTVPCPNPFAIRINHLQGERLLAADLEDELGVESWMRQLHMVGLHDTWGIALGLEVRAEERAGRGVRVAPGLAYDAPGRSLLVNAAKVAPNPWSSYPAADPSASFDLVLIADAERDRQPAVRDDGLCLACGPAPARDRPALLWRPSGRVRIGIEVVLVRAKRAFREALMNPGDPPPLLTLDRSVRLYAETQARPHIAAGTTGSDQPWQPWIPSGETVAGLETVVDVSDWGFSSTPTVIASLAIDTTSKTGSALFGRLAGIKQLVFTHVAPDPEIPAQQFRFRIIPPHLALLDPSTVPDGPLKAGQSYRSPLQVAWMGVEPVAGCRPEAAEVLGRLVRCCQSAEPVARGTARSTRRTP
jgi:hypothetical protein